MSSRLGYKSTGGIAWSLGGFIAIIAGVLFIAFWLWQSGQKIPGSRQLSGNLKTVCVGRFLIDFPVEARISSGGQYVGGFDLSFTEETEADFDKRLESLEVELAKSKTALGRPGIESAEAFKLANLRGKVLVSELERTQITEGSRRVMIESVDVRGMAHLAGLTIQAEGKGRALGAEKHARRLLQQLRRLEPEEIPTEPGFCAAHVIVHEPLLNNTVERATIFASLPNHPDVHIAFSTMAGVDPAPGLLERHANAGGMPAFLMRAGVTTLREGARAMNGLHGDELAMQVHELNFTTGYSFRWEMGPSTNVPSRPLVTLEFESGANPVSGGKPVQSSLTQKEMLQLWDRMAGSIRLRPTGASP